MYNAKSLLTDLALCGIIYSPKGKRGIYLMKMLLYLVASVLLLAGFYILDINSKGNFKHNIFMGFLGYLLIIAAFTIVFL